MGRINKFCTHWLMNVILYPEVEPYKSGMLDVGNGHSIYYEEVGMPTGIPVVFLHGGPGEGCSPKHRRYFDPLKYRVILFDQRGCGRSKPTHQLENNTAAHLVADIEALRKKLKIDRWMVFGASWGSTLGLLYAQAHPGAVSGVILRGIFLGTPQAASWLYEKDGAGLFFPQEYEELIKPLDKTEQQNVQIAYYSRLKNGGEEQRKKAAKQILAWQARVASMEATQIAKAAEGAEKDPSPADPADEEFLYTLALIENHYNAHGFFLSKNQIINNMHVLRGIPATLIHGRYDLVCPLSGAYTLHKAWPGSKLVVAPVAGHSGSEMLEQTMNALANFKPRDDF